MTKQELLEEIDGKVFVIGEQVDSVVNPDFSVLVDHSVSVEDPEALLDVIRPDGDYSGLDTFDDVVNGFLDVYNVHTTSLGDVGLSLIESEESYD